MPQTPLTVAELSEAELLTRIFPRLELGAAHSAAVLLGPGDDAAVVAAPDGRTVVSIDTQVQDQDFRLRWNNGYRTTGYDVGWKAAAQNLSDINAMGAAATSMVVSLTMPESLERALEWMGERRRWSRSTPAWWGGPAVANAPDLAARLPGGLLPGSVDQGAAAVDATLARRR